MYLLLSGEGASDIGVCSPTASSCDRPAFKEGPMAVMVDQLVEDCQGYEMSHFDTDRVSFVSEAFLAENKQRPKRKAMLLKGKKRSAETRYFFENARALAKAAKIKSEEVDDQVVAILFRDSDGTASAGRGHWQDKHNSILEGFRAEEYKFGVAMIPKPKSEAWLLCATKQNKYLHCASLEDESGNDKGRNPLKDQLSESLGGSSEIATLNQLLRDKEIDVGQIDMPSLNVFKTNLAEVVALAQGVAK